MSRKRSGRPFTVALIGNPNSGKSTLFNALTGARQKVGNWPGVTVEKKTGEVRHGGVDLLLVDLPGTYSLQISHGHDSVDQRIAQDFLLTEPVDLVIDVVDASCLERGLYLTTQLIDAGLPVVVALNMVDVAHRNGLHVDPCALAEALGVPVVPLVASRGEGTGALLDVVVNHLGAHGEPGGGRCVDLGPDLEAAVAAVQRALGAANRLRACAALEGDPAVLAACPAPVRERVAELACHLERAGVDPGTAIAEGRYRWIAQVVAGCCRREPRRRTLTEYLDAVFLHRWLAFPLFLGAIYLMFLFSINVGGAFIDLFDGVAGALFVESPRRFLEGLGTPDWLVVLLADGVGGGIQLVASFLPVIGALFLFQTFLEGSGYMARAAFVVDRLMRAVGLPGRAFVPLVVGFGCNVPAVMAARTLERSGDRLATILMAPFMSCGARLTVYVLFAAVFFPRNGQNVVFLLYLLGLAVAVATCFLLRHRLANGQAAPFLLELPNYHWPTLRSTLLETWHRLHGFMVRAGKAIVLVVVVLNTVNSLGVDGSFGNENTERSVLSRIGMAIVPVFEPIGVKEENWPAAVGLFSGVFAKEVVVGTLDALYTAMARGNEPDPAEAAPIGQLLAESLATVPENLAGLREALLDPLGLGFGDLSDREAVAEAQQVHADTFAVMAGLFDGALGAFAYLVFVLLYMPCVATLGAIYKEAGGFWAFFAAAWNTAVAYGLAVVVYQLGTLPRDPGESLLWVAGVLLLWAIAYRLLFGAAAREARRRGLIPAVNLP
ncbi:MAG: ferrous iron transport protein B [Porticoccaceae bacterium]|nr:MAG: ferrous iron transport protein B [Porticoccaceae bacterium]